MNITIRFQNNYGIEAIYPVCDHAKAFTRLTNTKTLTAYHIEQIKALGYTVSVQQIAREV